MSFVTDRSVGVRYRRTKSLVAALSLALATAGPVWANPASAPAPGASAFGGDNGVAPERGGQAMQPASHGPQQAIDHAVPRAHRKPAKPQQLQTIYVTAGIVGSIKASTLDKEFAPQIMDAITATEIGQLPDATITNSLSRIPGVQIDRSAGEGTSLNIDGLPQVASMLNGEVFLSADNIDSQQPNFGDIPAGLFRSVQVLKSPTASLLGNGITGTVNLQTWEPLDLKEGWTLSGTASGTRGSVTKRLQPRGNFLVSYNHDHRWGALFAIDGSNVTNNNSSAGLLSEGPILYGENAESALNTLGFLGAFNFYGAAIPSEIHQLGNGDVDVNGNGRADGAFFAPLNPGADRQFVTRKRTGMTAAFEARLGGGFSIHANDFYTHQGSTTNDVEFIMASTQWQHYGFVPLASLPTGVSVDGPFASGGWGVPQEFYTTQAYRKWPGEMAAQSAGSQALNRSNNFSFDLKYDNGGAFTGDARFISAVAHSATTSDTVEFTSSNGAPFPNQPSPNAVPDTVVIRPKSQGGDIPFNANGFAPMSVYGDINLAGSWPRIALGPGVSSFFRTLSNYRIKDIDANGDNTDSAGMNIIRLDGHYAFNDQPNIRLDFGVRNSVRTARDFNYNLVAPVYAGTGASDPSGCLVGYKAQDQSLNGAGITGACTAGDAQGFFRSNVYTGLAPAEMPQAIFGNMGYYSNIADTGVSVFAVSPSALDDALKFQNSIYPGERASMNPTASWDVLLRDTTGYAQMDFNERSGLLPFSGNVGVRVVRTALGVTQHINGQARPYGLNFTDGGVVRTNNEDTFVLPSVNISLNFRPDLKLRLAYSKNMMPLNLDQWGGGLSLSYNINPSIPGPAPVVAASSSGNPNLKPWQSTNFAASLEFYGRYTTASLSGFDVKLKSFVESGTVTNCDLPDLDGVVRHRCVPVSSLLQGAGASLHGFSADVQQSFGFLPGVWSHFGVGANVTYSPSNSNNGRDLAGNAIPFQDNSKYEGNLVLWFQNSRWQARIAGNYRSKEAVSNNYGGIAGLEEYMKPTKYVDASVSFQLNKNVQIFVQGSDLTNQKQEFYLTWPTQPVLFTEFERRFVAGVHVKF